MNTKMKVLSLAIVGMLGFAGSALAACPAPPGAWSSFATLPSAVGSPLTFAAGGLDGSACKMTAALQANATSAASFVRFNHAASEPSYRFQFLVDTTNLLPFSGSAAVTLLSSPAALVSHGSNVLLKATLVAGATSGNNRIRFIASKGATPFTVGSTSPTDLTPGIHRVEGKLTVGAAGAGTLTYWIDAPVGTVEPAPCATCSIANLDNGTWGGVKAVTLGLTQPALAFVSANGGKVVGFDTFDSRRQTYIGY